MFFQRSAVRRAALVLGLLFVPVMTVMAQSGLEVSVTDEMTGAPAPGVEVQLVNEAIGYSDRARTNGQGKARFPALSTAGSYRIVIEGGTLYEAYESSDIRLRATRTASVSVGLRPKVAATEEVDVRARASIARINTLDAEVSSTLVPAEVREVPAEGRDLTRTLYRLPNVTQATGFYPEAPNVSINGANALYATYLIDGLDNNENFLGGQKFAIPVGFVQDVTVLTNNYSVEYGRTGNGIFNVTSRSGSNELTGELFYITRPGARVDASTSFAGRDLSGNGVQEGFERHQFGVGIGGPIVKDKTFYYVNYERTFDDKDNLLTSPQLGVADTVPGENDFGYFSAKIDHVWTDSWRSSFRMNWGDVSIERQGGGLEGGVLFPSAGSTQKRESRLFALSTVYTGDSFVSESSLQYGRFDWQYVDPLNGASPQTTVLDPFEQTIAIVGHPGFTFADVETSYHAKQKFSFFRGDHAFTIGGEVILSDFDLRAGGNPSGNYRVKLTEDQLSELQAADPGVGLDVGDIPADVEVLNYDVEVREAAYGESQEIYALFFEDVWSLTPRLNLTLGLRYDYDSLSKGGASSGDDDNFAPRVSANFKLDEKSAIRAGAGLFYEKIVYAIYSDALQQNTDTAVYRSQLEALVDRGILPESTDVGRVTFDGNAVTSVPGVDYLEGPTGSDLAGERETLFARERRILNPNGYENPVTAQYTLGYQRQLRHDMLFYVDLIHTRSRNLPRLVNLNAPESWNVDAGTDPEDAVRTQAEANLTRPLADFDPDNDGVIPGGALNIVMTEMEGEAEYSAATLTLLKDRAADWYAYRVSYTLSKLENNTDDINFRASDGNRYDREWGPSLNDRRHVINALARVYPTDRLSISLGALIQSGQPVNRIPDATIYGTTDLNGDGAFFGDAYVGNSDRQPGESRNSDRLPWSEVFDLGIAYRWPIGTGEIELRADVFNVFNQENLSGFSNNATLSNQIQIGPASRGITKKSEGPRRQFQFGLRYVF